MRKFLFISLWLIAFSAMGQICSVDTLNKVYYDNEPCRCKREMEYAGVTVQAIDGEVSSIAIYDGKKTRIVKPIKVLKQGQSYYQTSISPDGKHFMTMVNDSILLVCNMNGKVTYRSMNFHSPVWYDKNHIVAMNGKKEGGIITQSNVFIVNINNGNTQQISGGDLVATFPCCSLNKVDFYTPQYRYTIKIELISRDSGVTPIIKKKKNKKKKR